MNLDILDRLKENSSNSGIFTDIDGTISKIAPTPEEAFVDDEFKHLLTELASKYKIVGVITGRTVDDAKRMLNLDILYSGIHGLEKLYKGKYDVGVNIEEYKSVFKAIFQEVSLPDGSFIENKGLVLAFHYRQVPKKADEIKVLVEALSAKYGLKLKLGKMVYELGPTTKMNKGIILDSIAEEFHLQNMFYAGDDVTDLDGFDGVHRHHGIAVGVCQSDSPNEIKNKADICVNSVEDMKEIFRYLLG